MKTDKTHGNQRPIIYRVARVAPAMATVIIACASAPSAIAQPVFSVIYSFAGGMDGGNTSGGLIASSGPSGAAQALYGVTPSGGTGPCVNGCGLAYQLTPPASGQGAWTKTALYNFTNGTDGAGPTGLSAETKDVNAKTKLYGTTGGGADGNGTVFKLAGQKLTTLYTFTGGRDGSSPQRGVVSNPAGELFAIAFEGGTNGCGTVIRLSPPLTGRADWTESTIWTFVGYPYGCGPIGIISDATGALYGTSNEGYGNAFELTPPGPGKTLWNSRPIANFDGTKGEFTYTGLATGRNGALYGTTYYGGTENEGVIYELEPPASGKTKWQLRVIWNFHGGYDGAIPLGPPIVDRSGALYGSTETGGPAKNGIIYKLVPPTGKGPWSETILYHFSGGTDGGNPAGALVADRAGTLYGTTGFGGQAGAGCYGHCGVVFSLAGTGYAP